MPPSPHWHFDSFRLDPDNACLWHGDQAIPLKPKMFAVLHYLVTHADHLVTKDALLNAVWPETMVSDGVLKVCIGDLRRVLGDKMRSPRFIATVHRRGYRFVAPVTTGTPAAPGPSPPGLAPLPSPTPTLPKALVGRKAVLEQLHTVFLQARQGSRQVVLITGEAGLGKTAVVDAFVASLVTTPQVWVARGQCVEQYGTREAYLPVLDAVGALCRGPDGERLVTLLRQQAPTWLVQMPWLLTENDRQLLYQELRGTTRERMLREFAEVVETLTTEIPLVLILEDLHWSDAATLDLLGLLARRRAPAQLVVVGTYRPVEVIVQGHPLRTVVQDLRQHGYATELPLAFLSTEAVAEYLAQRYPGHQFPATLLAWLYQRTDGHPLFLMAILQRLVEQGLLAEADGRWSVLGDFQAAMVGVPDGLQPLLEQQLTRLPSEAQHLLAVASVVGVEFAVDPVAASLDMDVWAVEEACEQLVRQQFLRTGGLSPLPDGTMAMRYAFTHVLYQQLVYQRLGAGQRLRLHQRIGAWLEATYAIRVREVAAELAEHFVRGRDLPRAVRYLQQAAENAAQRYAPHEVIDLVQRALALLVTFPETPQRLQQELDLLLTLGTALITTQGFATPEVEQTYARARALCAQVGETPQLFPTLRGLSAFYQTRGELSTARALGEQLDRLAQRAASSTPRLEAHDSLGSTLFFLGEYLQARAHFEPGIALAGAAAQNSLALRYDQVPGVRCLALVANTLWCLGFPVQARQRSQEALALAQTLAHPHSLAFVQHHTAFLHHRLRDAQAVQAQAEALLPLASAQGFPLYAGFGTCWRGWALAMQGQSAVGMEQLYQGMAMVLATGQTLSLPLCLVLLAEAAGHVGQIEEGLRLLSEALVAFETSGRGDWLAETYRLQGELLLRPPVRDVIQAEACFQQALRIAHRQQAKSWELRAALSLARLWQQQGQHATALQRLTEVYGWFTEEGETADLQEARALLAVLREEQGGQRTFA